MLCVDGYLIMGEMDEVKTMGWDKITIKCVWMFYNAMEMLTKCNHYKFIPSDTP